MLEVLRNEVVRHRDDDANEGDDHDQQNTHGGTSD